MKSFWQKGLCFALLAALLTITGCDQFSAEIVEEVRQVKIGVSLYRQDDTFVSSIKTYLEEAAKQAEVRDNVKITLNVMDSKGNQSIQNDHVELFISQGYDVMCINEVDRTSASFIIDKAKTADIPIVFFNREPVEEDMARWSKVYYVGSNPKEGGNMQGKIVHDLYKETPERLDKSGDGRIQYVMLEGEQGHQDAAVRTERSIRVVASNGILVEKLANGVANWQRSEAMAMMSQWIERFGDQIELVFCNNDDMALGAIDAYHSKEISNLPIIVGLDGTTGALDAVDEGSMYATVINDAKGQANAIFEIAYALAKKEVPENVVAGMNGKYRWLPHKIYTAGTER